MQGQRIFDVLPKLYQNFFPSFFETRIPEETAATCDDCAMWKNEEEDNVSSDLFYSKETKCCTYYPNLPNYLAGAILSTSDPAILEGQKRIREIIQSRVEVTPHGLKRPRKFSLLSKNASPTFGRSESMICPLYDQNNGKCSVWLFRYSKCSTWFCKYEAGADGKLFWSAFHRYLKYIEFVLIQYSLYKMRWSPENILAHHSLDKPLTVQEIEGQPLPQKEYRMLWKDRENKEVDFYIETYRLVSEMSPEAFINLSGITQNILLEELQNKSQSMLHPKVPKTLKRNPKLQVNKTEKSEYFLVGYSGSDPVEVSKRIYDLLDFFDGRTSNPEVIRQIQENKHFQPSEKLLTKLYRFRILVKP